MVSIENVLFKNPEIIIIPLHSKNADIKKDIWIKWHNIIAVSRNQIIGINGDLLHRFSPRALQGLELLCQAIDGARKN